MTQKERHEFYKIMLATVLRHPRKIRNTGFCYLIKYLVNPDGILGLDLYDSDRFRRMLPELYLCKPRGIPWPNQHWLPTDKAGWGQRIIMLLFAIEMSAE